ncbi:MAG TPA: Cj0069 family protein [Rhodopila sp.]|nr:Cj0069 family protein [Rhodopila sp.]
MISHEQEALRIGVLWRGDRRAGVPLPPADRGLGPLYAAFGRLPVVIEPVIYSDDAVDAVRQQLLTLDGVLVWVNPIQDGASRALLDPLLREVSSKGVWVSAHPDVILQMGTKEILYRTRDLGWGSDTSLYHSASEFVRGFPNRLGQMGRLVLKQGRGNGGNGVWKVELPDGKPGPAHRDVVVRVQDARSSDGSSEFVALGAFMQRCQDYFAWSGCLVDQAFQDRLADGMLRCYFCRDQVVGFCQQWPKGLLDEDAHQGASPASIMQGPDVPAHQALRVKAETEWVPQMISILGIGPHELPVIWDADFLFGPKTVAGGDSYVLCEINVSAVWPFPPMAAPTVAAAALDRTQAARALRSSAPTDAGGSPGR